MDGRRLNQFGPHENESQAIVSFAYLESTSRNGFENGIWGIEQWRHATKMATTPTIGPLAKWIPKPLASS
jgi:hypothetical protein